MNQLSSAINDEKAVGKKNLKGDDRSGSKSKYLIFQLGEEKFGILLSSVKEVIGLTEITSIPQVPSCFKGLINLRGKIISVIDLRITLSLSATEYKPKKTSIIITEISNVVMGFIVDDVEEVANYEEAQIERNIEVQSKINRDYLHGVAKTANNKLILLIDIKSVLSSSELELIIKNAS